MLRNVFVKPSAEPNLFRLCRGGKTKREVQTLIFENMMNLLQAAAGQPQQPSAVRNWTDIGEARASALYRSDNESFVRKSHKNPEIKELYRT